MDTKCNCIIGFIYDEPVRISAFEDFCKTYEEFKKRAFVFTFCPCCGSKINHTELQEKYSG